MARSSSYSPEVKALKLSYIYVLEKGKATKVTGKYTNSHQNRQVANLTPEMLRENLTKLNRKSLEKCHNAANCAKYIVADLEVAAGSAFT